MTIPYSFYREARKDIYNYMSKMYGTDVKEDDDDFRGLQKIEAFVLGRRNYEKHNTEMFNKAFYGVMFSHIPAVIKFIKKLFNRSKTHGRN